MSLPEVDHRRAVIDRRAVAERLARLSPGKNRSAGAADILAEALAGGRAEIDPDALTPREALDALYRLKRITFDS